MYNSYTEYKEFIILSMQLFQYNIVLIKIKNIS